MSKRRQKNMDWYVADENGKLYQNGWGNTAGYASLAVLMDIRDELQALNALLGCRNFIAIPEILRTIRRNTTKPKPKKARRKTRSRKV